jgi:hypothetical protein
LVEERSAHSLDQMGQISEYQNLALNSLNHDQTLNRLNGLPVNQRGLHDEMSANNFNAYNGSPIASEFDHRLESGTHDLDSDMKSFYSTHQLYTQSLNTVDSIMEFNNENLKGSVKAEFIMRCEEDEGIRLSDNGSDHDSESGMLHFCYFFSDTLIIPLLHSLNVY